MAPLQRRPDRRYAHPPGQTFAAYSPDGKYIITVGSNNAIRKFLVASDDEPDIIDDVQDSNTGLAVTNDKFVTCSEDGTVSLFQMNKNELDQFLVRCTLPVRDVALSPDGNWVAVASDETVIKLVNTKDMLRVVNLREQAKSAKHVSFHPTGSYLAASCTDGTIFIYSLTNEEPQLLKKLNNIIPALEPEAEATSKVAWHPDGRALATVNSTRDIVVISRSNWEKHTSFVSGHTGHITDFAWSPNGAFMASAGTDGKLVIWESKTQRIITKYDQNNIVRLTWHPVENIMSFTNSSGELLTLPDFVPAEEASLLKAPLQSAPLLGQDLSEIPERRKDRRQERSLSRDSLDLAPGFDPDHDDDDFIIDDDGGGYVEPGRDSKLAKRPYDEADLDLPPSKRYAYEAWNPAKHQSFQPGSTPWRGNRRYLCLNLIGFIWTVDQSSHNTVTVEFYDREAYRDFHFTDPFLYDKACLNDKGSLFSNPPNKSNPATILYRPHETWSTRSDFRITVPEGEEVISIALSDSYIVACTSGGYVRVYSLFGIPVRLYRQKHSPIVTCASWRDYIMIMGNGPVGADGQTQLTYSIEDVKGDKILQSNDIVALPLNGRLRSVFFSDTGDPVIFDSDGVLLILQHWRRPGNAKWVPLLDTRTLDRLVGGGKEESYWPVAVAQDKFHCIILKGGEKHPYFPRPLLSEFDFQVPIGASVSDVHKSTSIHEETVIRNKLLLSLLDGEGYEKIQRENAIDKALLQLLAIECRQDHGEKALELCEMFTQPRRTLDLAVKVALKYNRGVLAGKIGEMRDTLEMDADGDLNLL